MLAFLEMLTSNYYRRKNKLKDEDQLAINHKRVKRIMTENNLQAKIRQKKFIYYKPNEIVKKADLIQRHFKADAPNKKWYTDVSTITDVESNLYLSAIINGFNNEVISSTS